MKSFAMWAMLALLLAASSTHGAGAAGNPQMAPAVAAQELFFDDFEAGLEKWDVSNEEAIGIIDSGDTSHGNVLRLAPADARLRALIRGSESWAGYRIEGEVLFPDGRHNYLGLIYHYKETGGRVDLGSLYIKGNGSYIRVNPRRDWNPHRMLYEEMRVALTGEDAIRIGQWQRFAAEIVDTTCHLYVGNMNVPKVTFEFYEADRGRAGFKPRVVGGPTWIDNIRVRRIDDLSYRGESQPPGIDYRPDLLVTDWRVLGPLTRAFVELEKRPVPTDATVLDEGKERHWAPFETDPRGAVITGRITDFLGPRTVAYFATTVRVGEGETAEIQFSSIDDLTVWVNGTFYGYSYRDSFAWFDFGRNPEHPPTDSIPLGPGINNVLVRVRGGVYASGGFFARVARGGS